MSTPSANPNKALWEKGDFTRIASTMRESGEAFVGRIGLRQGMRGLDLGCGDGTKVGIGVSICFICDDALAFDREVVARGVAASRPLVGNRMWVTSVTDPDGYALEFESPTDVPEKTPFTS